MEEEANKNRKGKGTKEREKKACEGHKLQGEINEKDLRESISIEIGAGKEPLGGS